MSDEIEDFIRRAAERRKQQQGQAQGQRRPQPPRATPPVQPPARPRTLATPISQPAVVEAEVIPAEVIEHVSSYVTTHLDTRQFGERASHLGEQTALADDRLEARLHQKFDHQVGRLTKGSVNEVADIPDPVAGMLQTSSPSSTARESLVAMLRSPQSIRNAIIMNEILSRREF
jgi:hypothetical protein